jgi:hypothetical protein
LSVGGILPGDLLLVILPVFFLACSLARDKDDDRICSTVSLLLQLTHCSEVRVVGYMENR